MAPRLGMSDKTDVSPFCFLPNYWRLGGLLFATASSMCLQSSTRKKNLFQQTLSADSPHAHAGASEHANQQMLCICCLQASHSSHPVCTTALQRNIAFTVPPPRARRQEEACTLMGSI